MIAKPEKPPAVKAAERRRIVLFATLGTIALALIVGVGYLSRTPSAVPLAASEVHPQATLKVGMTAPEFQVSTTAGPLDLATASTPVFLEVFATWCPHCQREVPIIDQLNAQYGKSIQFVGVSGSAVGMDENSPETQADVVNFVAKLGVTYPVAFDPDLTVAKSYLATGFPTIVIIDRDKKVRTILEGEIPKPQLDKAIREVI
jgi:thiol-disulfide isomerase/thioredoxin